MLDSKKQLFNIALTEPIVFLRSSDPSGRLQSHPNDSPTLVRGILNLNVVKPIGISSIEVELTGVLTLIPPEGSCYLRSLLHQVTDIHNFHSCHVAMIPVNYVVIHLYCVWGSRRVV